METFFMLVMLVTSIVGMTFIVERGIALRWNRVVPPVIEKAAEGCKTAADCDALRGACTATPSSISRLLLAALEHIDMPREENEGALQTQARKEIVLLERGLVILEIIVGIAPLLGLVGTIYGMITLFGGMGEAGIPDSAILAKGISQILGFTMAGLLIAIPSLIAWNYYNKKVEMLAVEMEGICSEFLRRQYVSRNAAGGKP